MAARKSNKTAHVLNLLTGNKDDTTQNISNDQEFNEIETKREIAENKKEILNNVDIDQKESLKNTSLVVDDIKVPEIENEPPNVVAAVYEETAKEKDDFNIDDVVAQPTKQRPTFTRGSLFPAFINNKTLVPEKEQEPVKVSEDLEEYREEDLILVNLTEKLAKQKISEVMKKFNMCDCDRCYYDVLALTLNNITTKSVIIPKDIVDSKIDEYDIESAVDMITAISKSCVRVKIYPRH